MILVGIPSREWVPMDFSVCWANLSVYNAVNGQQLGLDNHRAAHPTVGRNMTLRYAEELVAAGHQISHIMWIDSDMAFPADTIQRLLAHDKDIVGAAYCGRHHPYLPIYQPLPEGEEKTELRKVARLPGGMMLVKYPVHQKLGEFRYYEDRGEDFDFCKRAIESGYDVWMDAKLTNELGHVGTKMFKTYVPYNESGSVADVAYISGMELRRA